MLLAAGLLNAPNVAAAGQPLAASALAGNGDDDTGTMKADSSGSDSSGSDSSTDGRTAQVQSTSSERDVTEASVASLQVDRAAVRSQLAEARAARDHQFDRWALTHLAAQAAREQSHKSAMEAVNAQQQVVVAHERVVDYAVRAFMSPPAMESMAVLAVGDAQKASRAHDLISITADDQGRVVDQLSDAEKAARRAARSAKDAAATAAERETANKAELEALEASVRTQQRLAAQIDARLDSAMAEVAALREVDREAAEELESQERSLAEDSREALGEPGSPASPQAGSSALSEATRAPKPATTSPPVTSKPTRPRPPGPPPPPPSGVVTWGDVTKVGTFWVHRSIASNVQGLLSAASAAGFNLTGGGFRDPASQISLRQAHCGPTYYDIYQKPASQCSPPTAIPGRSMHEQGKALDIKSGGALITSRSNAAFQWLAANASRYGFYNLPSEPWHWSTNGT